MVLELKQQHDKIYINGGVDVVSNPVPIIMSLDTVKVMDEIALLIFSWDLNYLNDDAFSTKYKIREEEFTDIRDMVYYRIEHLKHTVKKLKEEEKK